jgi:hypothetical protein
MTTRHACLSSALLVTLTACNDTASPGPDDVIERNGPLDGDSFPEDRELVARRAQIDMLVRQRDELQGQLTFLETESATLQTSLQTVFDRLGAARHRAASRPAGR